MALFESTWNPPNALASLPSASPTRKGKKRKHEDSSALPQPHIDLDKLMSKMAGASAIKGGHKTGSKKAKGSSNRGKDPVPRMETKKVKYSNDESKERDGFANGNPSAKKGKQRNSRATEGSSIRPETTSSGKRPPLDGPPSSRSQNEVVPAAEASSSPKRRKRKDQPVAVQDTTSDTTNSQTRESGGPLTALQSLMKNNLEGARFRFINEQLYKSSSNNAQDMMRKEPQVYAEYHTGFRHQTKSWPVNPVSLIATALSTAPPRSLIVDLGCGDAQLAKTLVPKGLNVLSFDLVSDGAWVIEADICTKIPLPGSENNEDEQALVDACVCSLSLMSTNWIGCVREAWRVLRMEHRFLVAEVTSRFKNVDVFVEVLAEVGFELVEQTSPSTHFILFEFRKVARDEQISAEEWEQLESKSQPLLKACEYKRR